MIIVEDLTNENVRYVTYKYSQRIYANIVEHKRDN